MMKWDICSPIPFPPRLETFKAPVSSQKKKTKNRWIGSFLIFFYRDVKLQYSLPDGCPTTEKPLTNLQSASFSDTSHNRVRGPANNNPVRIIDSIFIH